MKLAQVSDLHLLPPEMETAGGPTSVEVAEAVADDLAAIADGIDLVIVPGDLVDKGDAGSFATFERIFERVGLPIFVVPGNHDGPSAMLDYMRRDTPLAEWNLTNRVVETAGFRILGLNTSVDARTEGALDDTALALVEREIKRRSDTPLIVVMHHPPLVLGLARFDGFCRTERRDEFMALLGSSGRETIVFSGHVHRPYSARAGSVSCFVAGSMIAPHDSALPFGTDPIRPTEVQDFYFIHDIEPGGRHVVTPQRVRGLSVSAAGRA